MTSSVGTLKQKMHEEPKSLVQLVLTVDRRVRESEEGASSRTKGSTPRHSGNGTGCQHLADAPTFMGFVMDMWNSHVLVVALRVDGYHLELGGEERHWG